MRVNGWACALLAGLAAGCYRYEPVQSPRPGADVRARLGVEAAVRRSEATGEPVRHLSGSVVALRGDTLELDVLVARAHVALQEIVVRDTLALALGDVEELLERRLSPVRTVLFVTAVVAGTAAVVAGITSVTGGNTGDDGGDGGTRAVVVPLGSIVRHGGGLRLAWPP